MSNSAKQRKIDELIANADEALARKAWFETERVADKALFMARQENDFERMSRILKPLGQARRQRVQQALAIGIVNVIDQPITEETKVEPGCYLVQPPQVGSDARRLRLAALINEIPVAVLCREPMTRNGLVPVVAIGPGSTIRAKVPAPANPARPDLVWFMAAMTELGDSAIENLDPDSSLNRRVDALVDALNALPEHEQLHQALQTACEQAHELPHAGSAPAARPAKTKIKS